MPEPTQSTPSTPPAGQQQPPAQQPSSSGPATGSGAPTTSPAQQPSAEQLPWGVGHKAQVIPNDTTVDQMPFLAECSCGTQGHFREENEAYLWIDRHLAKYHQPLIQKTQAPATASGAGSTTAPQSQTKPTAPSKTGGG